MKKNISVYVNSEGIAPSGYYRILQYFKNDRDRLWVHSLIPNKIYKWWHRRDRVQRLFFSPFLYFLIFFRTAIFLFQDLLHLNNGYLIISKFIQPHYISMLQLFLLKKIAEKNKIIWDFDDNILEGRSISKREFEFLAKYSTNIIVISDFLKSLIPLEYQRKVTLLPTTDGDMCGEDVKAIIQKREELYKSKLILVWVATASNLCYLEHIIETLDIAALQLKQKYDKRLVLKILCNQPLVYKCRYLSLHNIRWERQVAQQEMSSAHVGIMPLILNRFTLGKGGFKLVQYLSIGLPLIASNVGFNKEIVTKECGFIIDDECDLNGWISAILNCASDWKQYYGMSLAALEQYEKKFSYVNNFNFWMKLCNL